MPCLGVQANASAPPQQQVQGLQGPLQQQQAQQQRPGSNAHMLLAGGYGVFPPGVHAAALQQQAQASQVRVMGVCKESCSERHLIRVVSMEAASQLSCRARPACTTSLL